MHTPRILAASLGAALAMSVSAQAAVLSGVGNFEGTAGVLGADGVVTLPPIEDATAYVYVTTAESDYTGAGLGQGSETNGSELTTFDFLADAGDILEYYFNYVTSDGSGFSDYAYAQLNNVDMGTSDLIFTARTTPSSDTVPGFGLPTVAPGVTLDPASTAIIPGGPAWSPLGQFSGSCYNGVGNGCGYTGWIKSTFTIAEAGTYSFTFGVVNWNDSAYDSGLAIAGLTIDGEVIIDPELPAVPLPAGVLLLPTALLALRSLRKKAA